MWTEAIAVAFIVFPFLMFVWLFWAIHQVDKEFGYPGAGL